MNEIIDELENIKNKKYLVIVEGKKDKSSLEYFGLYNILTLKNKPLFEIIESVNYNDVVILTDLDHEGRKMFSKLNYQLQRSGIKVHNKIRNLIFRSKIRQIEGLKNYSIL